MESGCGGLTPIFSGLIRDDPRLSAHPRFIAVHPLSTSSSSSTLWVAADCRPFTIPPIRN